MLHPCLVLVELMSSQYSLQKYSHLESQGGIIDNTETHCFTTQVLRHHACSPSITHCWSWLSSAENKTCFAWEPEKYGRFSHFLSTLLNILQLNDHCYPQSQLHCHHCYCIYQKTPTFLCCHLLLHWPGAHPKTASLFHKIHTGAYSIENNTCLARPNCRDSCEQIKMSCWILCRCPLILLLGFLSLSFKNDSKKQAPK